MIVTTDALLRVAYGRFAIGAYNINNMEQALGLFRGHMEADAPFIVASQPLLPCARRWNRVGREEEQ